MASLLRVSDIIQCFRGEDLELLTGPSVGGEPWPCVCFPLFLPGEVPFAHHVPADFAERAAKQGRLVYPADPWSTWTSEA